MSIRHTAKGTAYVVCEWTLVFAALLTILTRLYSRTFLTRSIGSDDFAIVIAWCIDICGSVADLESYLNGWAQHDTQLSVGEYSSEDKWEYISYQLVFIAFFFTRVSVILFTLRLLPSYKKWQQRLIYSVLIVNFGITVYAEVSYGVSCIPYRANWDAVPNAKCFSVDLLVITNQVNAILASVCDIATALIPQVLLWNVQMQQKTKRQLNLIFCFGLVTAALSIGRAATINKKTLTEDTTWNYIPGYYFSMFESKLGYIFACGPALRQLFVYRKRTKTFLPTHQRQPPNQDFEKMRIRINMRDILWYRNASMIGGRVYEAATSLFQSGSQSPPQPSSTWADDTPKVKESVLDVWEKIIKSKFRWT